MRSAIIVFCITLLTPSVLVGQESGFTLSTSPPISRKSEHVIGLRDPIAFALQLGTFSGISGDVRFLKYQDVGVAAEAAWGIDVSIWGLGIGWNAALRLDICESEDGVNDAFLLQPGVGYGHMLAIGGSNGWEDFFRDVESINVLCGLAWIHEFDFGVSSDLSIRPAMYFAIHKDANTLVSSLPNRSFQLSLVTAIRF
jgi:hypothetical protein